VKSFFYKLANEKPIISFIKNLEDINSRAQLLQLNSITGSIGPNRTDSFSGKIKNSNRQLQEFRVVNE
jgi:hypothetical protein